MIRILLQPDAAGRLVSMETDGHSGLAPKGKDVLCAAVSAIVETLAGALTEILKRGTVQRREGWIHIQIDRADRESELLFGAALHSIRRLQMDHPDRIQVDILPELKL